MGNYYIGRDPTKQIRHYKYIKREKNPDGTWKYYYKDDLLGLRNKKDAADAKQQYDKAVAAKNKATSALNKHVGKGVNGKTYYKDEKTLRTSAREATIAAKEAENYYNNSKQAYEKSVAGKIDKIKAKVEKDGLLGEKALKRYKEADDAYQKAERERKYRSSVYEVNKESLAKGEVGLTLTKNGKVVSDEKGVEAAYKNSARKETAKNQAKKELYNTPVGKLMKAQEKGAAWLSDMLDGGKARTELDNARDKFIETTAKLKAVKDSGKKVTSSDPALIYDAERAYHEAVSNVGKAQAKYRETGAGKREAFINKATNKLKYDAIDTARDIKDKAQDTAEDIKKRLKERARTRKRT